MSVFFTNLVFKYLLFQSGNYFQILQSYREYLTRHLVKIVCIAYYFYLYLLTQPSWGNDFTHLRISFSVQFRNSICHYMICSFMLFKL